MTRRRRLLFVGFTVLVAAALALLAGEVLLRYQRRVVERSEWMDPGLIEYDRTLGWRLTPGWRGRHRHHDFDVEYVIGSHGFRGPKPADGVRPRVVVLGDSFTFGIGVGEEDVFSRHLSADGGAVLNLGVPGYSTDQEVLLAEQRALPTRPAHVILVVCLINDVFDNARPFPLQAEHAKPRFVRQPGGLELENVPVPKETKPADAGRADLGRFAGADDLPRPAPLVAFLGRQEVFRRLGLFQSRATLPERHFDHRHGTDLALFDALVERLRAGVEAADGRLALALLPGRSFVETPASFSAQYQDHLRARIQATWQARGLDVVDVATALRASHAAGRGRWYHPHEGHLNAEGHLEVALLLESIVR